jgi:hypothetical protein
MVVIDLKCFRLGHEGMLSMLQGQSNISLNHWISHSNGHTFWSTPPSFSDLQGSQVKDPTGVFPIFQGHLNVVDRRRKHDTDLN